MRKKHSGYFWRVRKELLNLSLNTKRIDYNILCKISSKKRKYIIRHFFEFRFFFFVSLLLICSNLYAFQGVGDCQKLLADYAQLTNKSVFLPHLLDGQCVVKSEKHLPYILRSAGYNYAEKSGYIQIKPIEPPKEKEKESWKPEDKYYDVEFLFVNLSSALDCGFKMDDVIARLHNLDYTFSLGLALGCPALDYDGSFAFRTNAHLVESWSYSHGTESQRQRAQITSSTGAITNEYDYITTGLNLSLQQGEKGVSFSIKYTGNNGSVTTASGGITDEFRATTTDEFTRVRKLWLFPIGKEKIHAQYTLILRVKPRTPTP